MCQTILRKFYRAIEDVKFPLALRLVLSSLLLGLEPYGLPIYYICHVLPPSPPFHFTLRQRPLQSATATSPPNCLARSPMAGEEFGLAAAAAAAATVDAASGRSSASPRCAPSRTSSATSRPPLRHRPRPHRRSVNSSLDRTPTRNLKP